jgi:serine protease Do
MEGLLGNYDKNPKIGISIEDIAVGEGVVVKKVAEGSLAEKAGFKVNDLILKLNDEPITEVNDLKWEYLEVGKKLQFEIQRNGEKKTIELIIPKKINSAEL